jgi:hypothetical protein
MTGAFFIYPSLFFSPIVGPYMVLELCELGQLSLWLQKEKDKANEETSEQLCRIAYGISKGMLHLENKKARVCQRHASCEVGLFWWWFK